MKINCITASLYLRKNHLVSRGNQYDHHATIGGKLEGEEYPEQYAVMLAERCYQSGKHNQGYEQRIMLDPTLSVTLGFCCSPYLETIG